MPHNVEENLCESAEGIALSALWRLGLEHRFGHDEWMGNNRCQNLGESAEHCYHQYNVDITDR